MDRVKKAAPTAGEKVWELPMCEEYKDQIKSDVADMKNTGGRRAGSITAAMLLREFVEDTPWVHLDIAGVDTYDREKGVIVKGASGIPVRTLVQPRAAVRPNGAQVALVPRAGGQPGHLSLKA